MAKVKIGNINDFVNGINVAYAYGFRFCIIRKNEEFYALQDVCTHANCPLSTGFLKDYAIMCACHAAVFNIKTGEVISNPLTGEKIKPVRAFKITAEKDQVYIEF
ncbi:MAG: Rieske 2Fe-2S domain-containing protein [Candidatus Anstonellales archaeon]